MKYRIVTRSCNSFLNAFLNGRLSTAAIVAYFRVMMPLKYFMNWSGGKDSALALYKAKQQGINPDALITSVNSGTDRISMHGVRRKLLQQQANSIGIPLHAIELTEMPGMAAYENAVHQMHQQLKAESFTHGIFGDIFLEDLKIYREALLAKDDLKCLFPIWKMNSYEVVKEFIESGFKAIIVCSNNSYLDKSFCGIMLDESFLNDLPSNVDAAGENGEYHSFVFDGPLFNHPIRFIKGEIIYREYSAPILQHAEGDNLKEHKSDDCFTQPQPTATGFWFCDLLPAG